MPRPVIWQRFTSTNSCHEPPLKYGLQSSYLRQLRVHTEGLSNTQGHRRARPLGAVRGPSMTVPVTAPEAVENITAGVNARVYKLQRTKEQKPPFCVFSADVSWVLFKKICGAFWCDSWSARIGFLWLFPCENERNSTYCRWYCEIGPF